MQNFISKPILKASLHKRYAKAIYHHQLHHTKYGLVYSLWLTVSHSSHFFTFPKWIWYGNLIYLYSYISKMNLLLRLIYLYIIKYNNARKSWPIKTTTLLFVIKENGEGTIMKMFRERKKIKNYSVISGFELPTFIS